MNKWRWNLHATLAAVSAAALLGASAWSVSTTPPPAASAALTSAQDPGMLLVLDTAPPVLLSSGPIAAGALVDGAAPSTAEAAAAADSRPLVERLSKHRVQVGDTLNRLSTQFGVSVETLQWANAVHDPNRLVVGQELTVLPVNGVLHTVRDGETVAELAARYSSTAVRLIEANGLPEPFALHKGQRLLVPDGRPLAPEARKADWPAPGTGARYRQEFIEAAAAGAQESQRRTRVPASVTIAQAIHETGWGTSKLARESHNFFSIKARTEPGPAGVYWIDAWEVIEGRDVTLREPFRAYNSPDESFVDHGQFLLQNRRYHSAFAHVDDPRQFARAISAAGFATDPAYADKIIRIMDQYNLYYYDLR